ncbi:MAG TPA: peptide chain release factor N(5)-glutamine methyltransferase [Rhizomicrobium sp.]|jgi:release factor glutamine methyltransferase
MTSPADRLAAAGIDSARLDARVLREHANGDEALFEQFLTRRIRREPVAYITGKKGFWTLDLDVGPGVLVPRPETETLIEEALREFPDRQAPLRAVDFGVGSGAILLSFLSEYPGAVGLGIDRSRKALDWAERNARNLGFCRRWELVDADWSAAPPGEFDVIFSNPPYVTSTELSAAAPELGYEPEGALDGGADGLAAYRVLAPIVASRLNKRGVGFLEIGQGQGEAVRAILAAAGLETVRIVTDLSGIPRCVVTRLAKKPWK